MLKEAILSRTLQETNQKLYQAFFEERTRWYSARGKKKSAESVEALLGTKHLAPEADFVPVVHEFGSVNTTGELVKNDSQLCYNIELNQRHSERTPNETVEQDSNLDGNVLPPTETVASAVANNDLNFLTLTTKLDEDALEINEESESVEPPSTPS